MKLTVLISLVIFASAALASTDNAPFSIIKNYLIPLGEKIRHAEERMSQGRIVGGSPSNLGQFPYQVGCLASYLHITGQGVCGGSLVRTNRVISAAHCWFDGVHQAFVSTIVAGSNTIFSGGTRVNTSVAAMHPEWNYRLVRNDVLVFYLETPIAFSEFISPIALPSGNELNLDYFGWRGVASGFGQNFDGGVIPPNQILSHVEVDVISNVQCRASSDLMALYLHESHVCTSGFGGRGPCIGDSGGPLAVFSNGRPILIGITSFNAGYGCATGHPTAYSRVSSFINFLNLNL